MLNRTIYDEEHEIFRKSVRAWAEAEVFPHAEAWREDGSVSRDIWKSAGEQGFLCMYADEAYGGLSLNDFRYDMILTEEIGPREPGFFLGHIVFFMGFCVPGDYPDTLMRRKS